MKTGRTGKIRIAMTIITVCMAFSVCGIKAEARAARKPMSPSEKTIRLPEAPCRAAETQAAAEAPFSYEGTGLEAELLQAQNGYRAQAGLNGFTPARELDTAARIRAEEMAMSGIFSHTRPDGSSCFTVSADLYGENLYRGPREAATGAHIAEMLYQSPAHCENILAGDFTTCGIGIAQAADGTVYCVVAYGH